MAAPASSASLLQGDAQPILKFAAETAPYWNGPVEKFPSGTKVSFNLSQDASWKTSTGISFGPNWQRRIAISRSSAKVLA